MDKLNKLSLPATIVIASLIIGGFYFASQVNKQHSIERQQQIKIVQEKQERLDKETKEQQAKEEAEQALNTCRANARENYADRWHSECKAQGKLTSKCIDIVELSFTDYLEKYNLSDKVLLRGDQTSLYITQDMYLADLRNKDFKFDQMIYVVASEQELHFRQLFKILELLKKPYASKMYHLSYGLVHLPSGRMKSREGTVVDADDVMNEVTRVALKEVQKRHSKLSKKESKERSEFIAQAAIKFFLLRIDSIRNIIFNSQESLSFEGETGPYVQYTHARACSILRKAKLLEDKAKLDLLIHSKEHNLIKQLAEFPQKVKEAAEQYKPHLICHYLVNLSQSFNEFYHAFPVISDDKDLMNARLLLVDSVRQVLENGLNLLGITALEEM